MATYPITSAQYRQNGGAWWSTLAGSKAPCGKNAGGTNRYETRMAADFAAIRAMNVNNIATAAKLVVHSTADYGTSGVYARITNASDGILASGSSASGAANSDITITLDAAARAALVDGSAAYVGTYGEANGSYFEHYTTATVQAYLDITWTPRAPSPMPPSGLNVINPITVDAPIFRWTAGSDHMVSQVNLVYEVQLSRNGGSTWDAAQYYSAAGFTSKAINLRTHMDPDLTAKQYYYNTGLVFRVRTLAHWNGVDYASTWVTSGAVTVDYRIVPTAPSSIAVSDADVYEGESVTITLGLPTNYNTDKADGSDNSMGYEVYTGGGALLASGGTGLPATTALSATVGNLTTGLSDLVTTIRAYAKDAIGQTGPESERIAFTIRRFRSPAVSVSKQTRNANNAVIKLLISDTGYGGTQAAAQISKLQGRIDGGAWTDITPDSVVGLLATITIPDLAGGSRYTLGFRAVNVAPAGTALTAKTGPETTITVLPYMPSSMAFYNSTTGVEGHIAQSLIVGADPEAPVTPGSANVQYDIKAGRDIYASGDKKVWHEGNDGATSGLEADALAGNDDRSTASTTDIGRKLRMTLKGNGTDGLADGGSFHTIIATQTWTDSSGGNIHEIALTVNGNMYLRTAPVGGTWGPFRKIWHSGNDGLGSGLDADTIRGMALPPSTGSSGATWPYVPLIKSDGMMEIGKYIDFHDTSNDSGDTSVRLTSSAGTLTLATNLYVNNNVSAASITDRTPFYEGDALADINKITGDGAGNIDHETLPRFARKRVQFERETGRMIQKKGLTIPETETVEEEGRDLGAMISILTVAVQQLTDRITKLEASQKGDSTTSSDSKI